VVAHGNDGVGIAGALILELPEAAHVLVVRRGETAESLLRRLSGFSRAIAVTTAGDFDSRVEVPLILGTLEGSVTESPVALAGERPWRRVGEAYRQVVFSR
jgi:hypothetical protein